MDRPIFTGLRRLASRLCAGLPLLALGCATGSPALAQLVTARASAPTVVETPPPAAKPKELPIGLDTVLRLAEEQNGQVALAREKVHEAYADQDLANSAWLPAINVGTAYYRHEGGIQNPDGTLIESSSGAMLAGVEVAGRLDPREAIFAQVDAERKVWQQKGELSRVTSETLLDAATTYIDLMTARTGEAIVRRTLREQEGMLDQAHGLAKAEPGTQFLVEGFEAEVLVLRQSITKLHRQGDAAATKLAYLLGIGPGVELVPVDGKLIPIELVDPSTPTEQLVGQAWRAAPACASCKGCWPSSPRRRKGEGLRPVHAGRGDARDRRGVRHRHRRHPELGQPLRLRHSGALEPDGTVHREGPAAPRRLADSAGPPDLPGRAREVDGGGGGGAADQPGRPRGAALAGDAVRHANQGYQLSNKRLKDNVPGSSTTEVVAYIRGLQSAYLNYLGVVSDYDKAQLRLLVLTGAAGSGHEAGCGR